MSSREHALSKQEGSKKHPRDLSRYLQKTSRLKALSLLPPSLGRAFLDLMGLIHFSCHQDQRAAIIQAQNYCLALRKNNGRNAVPWRLTRAGLISHYYEKLFLACKPMPVIEKTISRLVRLRGLDILDRELARGSGVLLVSGHYGGVEFIPCALAVRGYPMTILVHCKTTALRNRLEAQASRVGARLLDPKAGPVFFRVLKELRENRIVLTQCDEFDKWQPYRDKKFNFLGLRMNLDKSLDLMARKSKASVLFTLNHRRPKGRYELVIERPEEHPAASGLDLISQQCLAVLSSYIYMHPEAWYEWKKIAPLAALAGGEVIYENNPRFGLPDPMAFQTGGTS